MPILTVSIAQLSPHVPLLSDSHPVVLVLEVLNQHIFIPATAAFFEAVPVTGESTPRGMCYSSPVLALCAEHKDQQHTQIAVMPYFQSKL